MNASLNRLEFMLKTKKIPHLILFTGSTLSQLEEIATDFTKRLQVVDLDTHLYHPEGKLGMHSIDAMRRLSVEVSLPASRSPYKVFILFEAERMLEAGANALLKTFEEPNPRTLFFLLSTHPERIISTLLSRAQTLSFGTPLIQPPTPFQLRFLEILSHEFSSEELKKLGSEIDAEKKSKEKALRSELSNDLSLLQKEAFEKGIDGTLALYGQEIAFSLLETALQWAKERTLQNPAFSFEKVQKAVFKTRLALERSIKLETCLEALCLQLIND